MNGPAEMVLQWLLAARRQRRTLFLLFDYDGTLTPIVEHPDQAVLTPDLRGVLTALAAQPGMRLGVISGRALENLKSMVQVAAIDYAGTDGLELDLGGTASQHPEAGKVTALMAEVHPTLQETISAYSGAWIETKPLGLTVHFRQVAQDRVEDLRAALDLALHPRSDRLRILPGPMALEILPALGWTKGTAVRRMVEHAGRQAVAPCYFGDHTNDASAFEAILAMGGLAVGIGQYAPATARVRLPGPHDLFHLLASLVETPGPRLQSDVESSHLGSDPG